MPIRTSETQNGERPEDPQVDQRVVHLVLDDHEQRQADSAEETNRPEHPVAGPAPVLALGEGQQQGEQGVGDGEEARGCPAAASSSGGSAGSTITASDRAHDADRHVDEEDQPPVEVLDQRAAQRRADGRGDHHAEPVEAHRRADLVPRHDPEQQRHRDHRQHRRRGSPAAPGTRSCCRRFQARPHSADPSANPSIDTCRAGSARSAGPASRSAARPRPGPACSRSPPTRCRRPRR